MATILKTARLAAVAASMSVVAIAGVAVAQSGGAATGLQTDLPPGYDGGYSAYPERERETYGPFGSNIQENRGTEFAPLNEFAGQTRRYEPGLLGEALGRVKRSIIGEFRLPETR